MSTRELIDDFLSRKRIAVIGVSREPRHFSRGLFRDLVRRGYDAVPVNPKLAEVEGRRSFAGVGQIEPPVEAALIMTPPAATDQVVRDCRAAGIKLVWLYRAVGNGAVSPAAIDFCDANGIGVIPGNCPFMFLPGSEWFHRAHAFLAKLTGHYPR